MTQGDPETTEVDRFILDRIDTIPHLEALLLLWSERLRSWSAHGLAERLWVEPELAKAILRDLDRDHLIVPASHPEEYCYGPDPEKDRLLTAVNEAYRHDMIRISTMIHSKASTAVRQFARAFRIKKEQE